MITLIDYGAGNLRSVEKAFHALSYPLTITNDPDEVLAAEKAVLPGVGSFADAMHSLKVTGLDAAISEVIRRGVPFLGICLGMQLMYEHSEEGDCAGLGILKGNIRRFPASSGLKIPQIGWNNLIRLRPSRLLEGLSASPYVYFVHSYYVAARERSTVAAITEYGVQAHVLVEHENLYLTQFHPEKSGKDGLAILDNFGRS